VEKLTPERSKREREREAGSWLQETGVGEGGKGEGDSCVPDWSPCELPCTAADDKKKTPRKVAKITGWVGA